MIHPGEYDDDRPIWYVNRMLVVLRPQEPFLQWVAALSGPHEWSLTPEEIELRLSSFLIPVFDHPDDALDWLEDQYRLLFEAELWQWTEDESLWPRDRSWEVFREWFAFQVLDAPWDLVSAPLTSDPPPPEGSDGWH